MKKESEQLTFFKALFDKTKGDIEIRTITQDKEIRRQYYYKPGDIKRLVSQIPEFKDTNIYFGVCPRAGRVGDEEHVKEIRALWVDLDQTGLDILKGFKPKPSIIIGSGYHYHLYWLLDKVYQVKDRKTLLSFKGYTKGLSVTLKGDSSFDLARVLRVPGTLNLKDPKESKKVKLIEFNPDRRYRLSEFDKYKVKVEDIKKVEVSLSGQRIPEKFWRMLRRDTRLKITYEGKREDLKDKSRSGFDMALVNILITYGFKGNEIAAILKATPYNKGKRLKEQYLILTIAKAKAALTQGQKDRLRIKQAAMDIALEGMNLDELRQAKFEPEQFWVSKGLVPKIGFVILAGLKGTGKTSLALQLCAKLIKGSCSFLEQFKITSSPKILYVFAENIKSELLKIIKTQEKALNLNLTKEQDLRLEIQPRGRFDLLTCWGLAVFKELFNMYNPDVVIFDPIARFLSARDINSMSIINNLFDNLLTINEKCLYLFVAHFRKPQIKGKVSDEPMYEIVGSSGFVNNCDTVITIDKADKRRSGLFNTMNFEVRRAKPLDSIYTGMNPDTRVCKPVSRVDILTGGIVIEDIVSALKKDCKGRAAPSIIATYASKKFKVSQKRVYELLNKAKNEGLVAKEKGKFGEWFAL